MTRVRWMICWLLFFAVTIAYIDRAVLAVLEPMLAQKLHWSQIDYSRMVAVFQLAYAIGYVFAGRLIDRIGVRWGLLLCVALWSLAAMQHAAVETVFGFLVARALLGLAQGGMFPAAIRAVAEWYPKQERALATGLFNSGSNIGAVICPLIAPWLALQWGWRPAFLVTGGIGIVWAASWIWLYQEPAKQRMVSPAELEYIRKDPPDPSIRISWHVLFGRRQTWAYAAGMAASAPIWWFYIFWAPDFLNKRYHLGLTQSSLPLTLMFIGAGGGGIAGGWLSSALLRRGWTVNRARKVALLLCALCVLPVAATPFVPNPWVAATLVGLAAAAHSGFAANLFTLVSDTVPKQAVSSVVGIGGMVGALGGVFFAQLIGWILTLTNNNYAVPFAFASTAYLAGLAVIHVLLPQLQQMRLENAPSEIIALSS